MESKSSDFTVPGHTAPLSATGDAAEHAGTRAEMRNLIADVQDLFSHLAHISDPDVIRLRQKVETAIAAVKASVASGSASVRHRATDAMHTSDQYVRAQPWQAVGVAALAGIIVGALVARR